MSAPSTQSFRFRQRAFLSIVLAPERPLERWLGALDSLLSRDPAFFVSRPAVLDLVQLPLAAAELSQLLLALRERSIRICGIEGMQQAELPANFPPALSGGRSAGDVEVAKICDAPQSTAASGRAPSSRGQGKSRTLLIDAPVRSGQCIVNLSGDVAVMGAVASGAEIIAGGSVHVYGTLRGRAMAGAGGDPTARIFCQKLEAELLAIDGLYRTSESMGAEVMSRPVQARLDGDTLVITAIN